MLLPDIPESAVWAIYFAPIASLAVIAVSLRDRPLEAGRLAIAAVGLSWVLALWALDTSSGLDGEAVGFGSHTWFSLLDLDVPVGVRLDGLTAIMLVVVTSVSLVVHVYSTGYMHGDSGYARYFAFMSLFTAAMLGLVLSSSLIQLFMHWDLLGLPSYLLIGFCYHRPPAPASAHMAFIVTPFVDFGVLLVTPFVWS